MPNPEVDDVIEDILEHHGVKGMKWGVRRAFDKTFGTKTAGRSPGSYKRAAAKRALTVGTGLPSPAASRKIQREARLAKAERQKKVTVADKGKKIKTSGGKGLPANPDAIPARVIGQKIKKSGMKSVSDAELQTYAKRIQMEQNVSRLMYNEKSGGARFVDGLLNRQGSRLANDAAQAGGAKAGRTAVRYATKKSRKVAKVATAVALA